MRWRANIYLMQHKYWACYQSIDNGEKELYTENMVLNFRK